MAEAKFGKMGAQLKHGYNSATICESNMMMDIGIQVMSGGEKLTFNEQAKEVAYVILTGEVKISWENNTEVMKRTSLFDENPTCLHVPLATEVTIEAVVDSEVLIQKTENDTKFAPKFYHPEDVQADVFGGGVWSGTATRTVRTIFDYENAPYSNMVNGEVINSPGRWSSYIPHFHPQPEVYVYKFDRPQGFGAAFIGEDTFRTETNAYVAIPGGDIHPQVTAPGYAMWYSWMIRHLPDDPWAKTRIVCEEHAWLEEDGAEAKIWDPLKK
ncbi:5-deoxyglucuronate isomerase [Megamonas rupellensis]|uniref:5-deoxyglucuronate isomerase n=1 Tax=Megamonas rupellensis TaxID=491921 RepID=A0A412CFW2_9FIRM|nr:5-deoxy-glucuronate isomerase [Megamonas rupellensis]RGQ84692.1 5-deoxyglucuronate isomerase [Megamonas rupellensis]